MVQVSRRRFLILSGTLLAGERATARPIAREYRVGAMFGDGPAVRPRYLSALTEGLAAHGFIEGKDLHIEARASGAPYIFGLQKDLPAFRELLAQRPDALFTCTTFETSAAQEVTRTVPIVFAWVSDPVTAGFVKSYAHPGGNITGVTNRFGELLIKRIGLARELIRGIRRIAVIDASGPFYELLAPSLRNAAARAGIELIEISGVGTARSIDQAAEQGAGVVIPCNAYAALAERKQGREAIEWARRRRLPVIFAGAAMVEAGGLMSYGTNPVDGVRRGADLLARVLQGEKPADIAVDQAARFELVLNVAAAKAIGLKIPQSIMLRADRIIE